VNSGWTHPAARPLLGARLEAGLEYGAARDHERAVAWLAEGLDLAIATGDRERLVAQMSDLRRASLVAATVPGDLTGDHRRIAPEPQTDLGVFQGLGQAAGDLLAIDQHQHLAHGASCPTDSARSNATTG
jgi:TPR repeat protein